MKLIIDYGQDAEESTLYEMLLSIQNNLLNNVTVDMGSQSIKSVCIQKS